jgi:hypothetical protein
VVGVAQQRKIQLLLGFEQRKRLFIVRAGAKNESTGLLELRFCVTKLGRFGGSTGGIGSRKEKEHDALALEILKRDLFAFIGFQPEIRGFLAWLQHGLLLGSAYSGVDGFHRSGKQLSQSVVDRLRAGLSAGGLHHLADKKLENAFIAGFELGNVVGVAGDDLASGRLDGV